MSAASAGPRVFLDSVTEEILNPDDEVLLSGSNPWKKKVQNIILHIFFQFNFFFNYEFVNFTSIPARRISWTKETTECFSGTLHKRLDNLTLLLIASSAPETVFGLKGLWLGC